MYDAGEADVSYIGYPPLYYYPMSIKEKSLIFIILVNTIVVNLPVEDDYVARHLFCSFRI